MAAAVGIRLPVKDAIGSVIVDIGGGTTDVAVISLAGIVRSKNLKIAGDMLNTDIINYMKEEFKLLIGERTAENVKIAIGAVVPTDSLEAEVRGRDMVTGLPRKVIITDSDIREAMSQSIESIVSAARETLETTPPEILADIMKRGIHLVGGGALIKGLDGLLIDALNIPVTIAQDPLTAIARGAGIILEDLDTYKSVLIESEDDISASK